MVKCPACFHVLSPDHRAWLCSSGRCVSAPDAQASRLAGFSVGMPPVTEWHKPANAGRRWNIPTSIFCATCNEITSTEVCPECHYGPLSHDWRDSSTTCVAMAGARYTGKSLYVAVVVKQLELLAARLGTTVVPANDYTQTTYRRVYEEPLFQARSIMPPTNRVDMDDAYQREPLIFTLGVLNGKRRYLVIRDVAGEDLEKELPQDDHLRFLSRADGVFFLFDPLRVGEVREQLRGVISLPETLGGDPRVVLSNVLRLIGTESPQLGILVSKFDALQDLRSGIDTALSRVMSNPGAAMSRDPSLARPTWDEADAGLIDQEIRSLLVLLRAQDFVLQIERPHRGFRFDHKFFGVSALGAAPTGEQLHDHGIAPFRCLDPMKWVLHQTGAL